MEKRAKTRVMAVEHNPALRDGLIALIEKEPDMEMVGVIPDTERAFADLIHLNPQVAIIDVDMPRALELMRGFRAACPLSTIIPLVDYEWDDIAKDAVEASGSPSLPKDRISRQLLGLIRKHDHI